MKIVGPALAALLLATAAPIFAASPPAPPNARYYVIAGRSKLAGPFRSYFVCDNRLHALGKSTRDAPFCASDWIVR